MATSGDLGVFFLIVLGIVLLPGLDFAYVAASALSGGRAAGLAAVGGIVFGGFFHVAMAAVGISAIVALQPEAFDLLLVVGGLYLVWIGRSLLRSPAGGENSADDGMHPADTGEARTADGLGEIIASAKATDSGTSSPPPPSQSPNGPPAAISTAATAATGTSLTGISPTTTTPATSPVPPPDARITAFRRGVVTNLLNPKAYAFTLAILPQYLRPESSRVWLQACVLSAIIAATQIGVYGSVALLAGAARARTHDRAPVIAFLTRTVGVLLIAGACWGVVRSWRPLS